ncbi:UNVERIFIED_ORG: uncharacterized membrane protein YdcZ (DUF606 family), partial [Rhizobium sophorae]|uniref:DMT family transporter n=1 Tax=Rhizobium leguminosarum TaxID=384 RepID=UPI00181298E6
MTTEAARNSHPIYFIGAFATGGLLTFMVHLNGELARYGNPLFSSWTAHGTGIIAAVILLLVVHRRRRPRVEKAPNAPELTPESWTSTFGGFACPITAWLLSFLLWSFM